MCFVGNTYAVIVQEKRTVFRHPVKTHLIQSLFCWLAPALVVAGCLFFAPPGYIFLFADLLGAGPASMDVAYFAVTLPVQATLGISLCLLWCIVWYLRKVRIVDLFNKTTQCLSIWLLYRGLIWSACETRHLSRSQSQKNALQPLVAPRRFRFAS